MDARVLLMRTPALAALAFSVLALGSLTFLSGVAGATPPGDNGRIAFVSDRDGDFEIYTMNSDGSGVLQLTSDPADDFNPNWSPDGNKIAFASNRGAGGDYDVYVMNSDGSGVIQLTSDAANDWTPNWSPDGTEIAFGSTRSTVEDVYKMNADGTNVTQLTNDPQSDGAPAFSPDGTQIAFRSMRGGCPSNCYWELLLMDADGSNETELTSNDEPYEVDVSWAPDGMKLTYQVNPPLLTSNEVFTINADGTGETNITNDLASDAGPSWSPDGGRIAFATDRDGDFEIYTMSPSGSSLTRLTTDAATDLDPDWQRLYHVRPVAASPFRASLVPAYKQCTSANNTHGAPAAYPSCSPPAQESSNLTMGTPNANGQASQGVGSVRIAVINTSLPTEDDQLEVSLTDVRCRGASGGCAGAMEDYTGDVLANATIRITDRYNGAALNDPGTVFDIPFSWSVPCTATGPPGIPNAIGSACASVTTANAVVPGFVKFGQRQIIELGQMRVFDGGADGSAATAGNNLFQIQGIFNP
jgi:Tol biopolymer transport system component